MANVWFHRRGLAGRIAAQPAPPPPPDAGRRHDVRCLHCGRLLFRVKSLTALRQAGPQAKCPRCKQTMTAMR